MREERSTAVHGTFVVRGMRPPVTRDCIQLAWPPRHGPAGGSLAAGAGQPCAPGFAAARSPDRPVALPTSEGWLYCGGGFYPLHLLPPLALSPSTTSLS